MPRPGLRPYVCERRAWHSDRHQPLRGSLIQEIFRVVDESHSSATKRNKEWQDKLPVVVLKAEEIMYSKANSEAEYMDLKTLKARITDAVNTIIRRDESTETGKLLQPCIEAALNLGCIARRTSRSQRNCNPGCYLNPGTQEAVKSMENVTTNSLGLACYSGLMKPKTMNVNHLGSESQNYNAQNTCKFPFASKNGARPSQCLPVGTYASSRYLVYPLYYGNLLNFEELKPGFEVFPKPVSNIEEPSKMGVNHNVFSSDVDSSNNLNQTDVRNASNDQHEKACDLSLWSGPLLKPHQSIENSRPLEIENIGFTLPEWNKFSDLTPPVNKNLSSCTVSDRNDNLNSSSREWSVEGEHSNVDATMKKRKMLCSSTVDQQFHLPTKLPYRHITGKMKDPAL